MKYLAQFCRVNVQWDDVLRQINEEMIIGAHKTVARDDFSCRPTIVTQTTNNHGSLKNAFHTIAERIEQSAVKMHVYVSFSQGSSTFGRHNDKEDVLIVQAIGSVAYTFDSGDYAILWPGDALFIPKGEYHDPGVVSGPRATLSFSVPPHQNLTLKP